jgi:uncharacterized membrane protein
MSNRNKILRWFKWAVFAVIVHALISLVVWGLVLGVWFASKGSYESKALQLGVLAIVVLPLILDVPAILTLLKVKTIGKLLS